MDSRINQFEMATAEELKQQLEEEREQNRKLQEDVELMKVRNELEIECMKQQQWNATLDRLKEAREQATMEHDKCMENIDQVTHPTREGSPVLNMQWFKTQMETLSNKGNPEGSDREEIDRQAKSRQEKEAAITEIRRQQEELARKLVEL